MRRALSLGALALALAAGAFWAAGGWGGLLDLAAATQRATQEQMAGALRALHAGSPGALAALMGLCFGYGVAHAAGPGHGKVLIGGYGFGSRARAGRLAAVALAASLAQATTAVALVLAGTLVLAWSRERMQAAAEAAMAPLAYAAIAAVGLWLALRGVRALVRSGGGHGGHAGGHAAGDDGCCGHRHGPDPDAVSRLTSLREGAALVAAIGLRPCTGSLFVLIVTWNMGLFAAGVAGAYAMALGTAAVTVGVALVSVLARDGALLSLPQGTAARRAGALIELAAGLAVAAAATALLLRTL